MDADGPIRLGPRVVKVHESPEYRGSHYRVYDEDGFTKDFAVGPPQNATLPLVTAYLVERFQGTGGTGFDSKDLVVLLGPRIVAVVREGAGGLPVVTTFAN